MSNNWKKQYDLWNKVEEYTDEEFSFLKSYIQKQNYKVNYGFYNKESSKNMQIAVIFDTNPSQMRKTGAENNWTLISSRKMTNKEVEEYIIHYFRSQFKRFLVFYYKNVDRLIHDDTRLEAITPEKFIDECRNKGYSGSFQLKLEY